MILNEDSKDSATVQSGVHGKHAAPNDASTAAGGRSTKRTVLGVVAAILIIVAVVVGGICIKGYIDMQSAADRQNSADVPSTASVEDNSTNLPDNPIDFAELQAQNSEIYAWIYVPGTNINLPVLQSAVDDNFYLDHDVDKNYNYAGAIYSQSKNALDFSDPVTLLYGHNLLNSTMFTQLHYFEDATFFNEHTQLYIYTPGHILTYDIVAAYMYDNRHILNSFDFSDPAVVQSYFNTVMNPQSLVMNMREGTSLTAGKDTIVQLSTCMDGTYSSTSRYIVTGVLSDDQATK
jgi:sortase B